MYSTYSYHHYPIFSTSEFYDNMIYRDYVRDKEGYTGVFLLWNVPPSGGSYPMSLG